MAEGPDRQELLTALTTEHFTLQGARSQTVSESAARASLYVFSVSSTLVALGFIGQVSEVGDVFDVFALTVLPTLYLLGLFTFVRLVESSVEDILYGRAINRIRSYYLQRAGEEARWFMLSGHDDPPRGHHEHGDQAQPQAAAPDRPRGGERCVAGRHRVSG